MRLSLTALCLVLFIVGAVAYARLPGSRQAGVLPVYPPTPYFLYSPIEPPRGRILVVHGLDASKEVMNLLCYALSDSGFEVYSIDLPGHGDSTARFDGLRAKHALNAVLDQLGPGTMVLGHSFGAALLADLATDRDFGAMVLLSPGPRLIERIRADRVLVVRGQFDLPAIRKFTSSITQANSEKATLWNIPWSGHTGYIFRPRVVRNIVEWVGGEPSHQPLHTSQRLALLLLMLVASICLGISMLPGKDLVPAEVPLRSTILVYIAAGVSAYLLLGAAVVMAWLRLFAMDYLISFVLIAGLIVCVKRPRIRFRKVTILRAGLAAAFVVIALGLAASEFAHLSLSDGRWWRFAGIAAATLPLLVADETYIRPLRPWWKATGVALITRLLLGAFIATGVLTFNRSDAFIILILHIVILFWILLWLAGEIVHRHTQDPLATALFGALVQGWIFAAVFITT